MNTNMRKLSKYTDNLSIITRDGIDFVRSYNTEVAKVNGEELIVLGYWSVTTSKHINYVAKELGLKVVNRYA